MEFPDTPPPLRIVERPFQFKSKAMKSKIAFISTQASPLAISGEVGCGGHHFQVAESAKGLADMGYEVDIYTRRNSLDLDEIVYFCPHIRVINVVAGPAKPIPYEETFIYMDEFADMMLGIIIDHNIQYSLLHVHIWLLGHVAIRIKQELAIPFVVNYHGPDAVSKHRQTEAAWFSDERREVENKVTRQTGQITTRLTTRRSIRFTKP